MDYYKEHYQGKEIQRKEFDKPIKFSQKGRKETIAHSNEDKLNMVPAVWDVVKTGKIGKEETPDHPRKDGIVSFIPISKTITFKDKKRNVEVLIAKDNLGNLYYDLFTDNLRDKYKALGSRPCDILQGAKGSIKAPGSTPEAIFPALPRALNNSTLSDDECTVNIFFNAPRGEEKYSMKRILEILGLAADTAEEQAAAAVVALKETRDKAVTALNLAATATATERHGYGL